MQVRRTLEIAIPCLILLAAAVAYFPILSLYRAEAEMSRTPLEAGEGKGAGWLDVTASVLSVDPAKNELSARLQFEPKGSLLAEDKYTLAKDLTVYVNDASGNPERPFRKGKPMSSLDVTLSLYDGFPTDYPFDAYLADFDLGASTPSETETGEMEDLHVTVRMTANVHGYRINADTDPENLGGGVYLSLEVRRSTTTIYFAVFVMVAQWVLALCVLAWALSVLIRKRRIEATLFGWVGAMLFAFPALRNAVPGAPPIGSMTDFIAFFWAEGIVMLSIVILMYCYLSRPLK